MSEFEASVTASSKPSVAPPRADKIITMLLFFLEACLIISITPFILFALATELPPNFKTCIYVYLKNLFFAKRLLDCDGGRWPGGDMKIFNPCG
jgi:hypothetical protein